MGIMVYFPQGTEKRIKKYIETYELLDNRRGKTQILSGNKEDRGIFAPKFKIKCQNNGNNWYRPLAVVENANTARRGGRCAKTGAFGGGMSV